MSCCPAVSNVSDSINFNVTEAVAVATAVGLPQDAQGIPVTIFISFIHGVNFSSASVRTEVMPETPAGARAQTPLVRYQVVHAGWQFKGRTIPQFEPVAHFPGFPASVTRLRVRVTVLPCLRCEAYGQEAWTKFQFVSVHVRQSYHPDKLNNKVSLSASRDPADRALQLQVLSYGHSGTRMSASITAIWEQAYNVSIMHKASWGAHGIYGDYNKTRKPMFAWKSRTTAIPPALRECLIHHQKERRPRINYTECIPEMLRWPIDGSADILLALRNPVDAYLSMWTVDEFAVA